MYRSTARNWIPRLVGIFDISGYGIKPQGMYVQYMLSLIIQNKSINAYKSIV